MVLTGMLKKHLCCARFFCLFVFVYQTQKILMVKLEQSASFRLGHIHLCL